VWEIFGVRQKRGGPRTIHKEKKREVGQKKLREYSGGTSQAGGEVMNIIRAVEVTKPARKKTIRSGGRRVKVNE